MHYFLPRLVKDYSLQFFFKFWTIFSLHTVRYLPLFSIGPINIKTGLQPVSRTVEQVHCFEGLGVGAKSTLCKVLGCQYFVDRHTYRTGRCMFKRDLPMGSSGAF